MQDWCVRSWSKVVRFWTPRCSQTELESKSENNWSRLGYYYSMNLETYVIICITSVHAIAEAERPASVLKKLILASQAYMQLLKLNDPLAF